MKARNKNWPARNTGPLVHFLEELYPEGICLSVLADRLGCTKQCLSAAFRLDNMHLSRAEGIARALGYSLHLEYEYVGEYPVGSRYVPSGTAGNLYGLEEYCQRLQRTANFVAASAGCRAESVKAAITKGDIMLDTLSKISEEIDLRITWTFKKNR